MVGHFVELTKDRLEGGSNSRAEEQGQRWSSAEACKVIIPFMVDYWRDLVAWGE